MVTKLDEDSSVCHCHSSDLASYSDCDSYNVTMGVECEEQCFEQAAVDSRQQANEGQNRLGIPTSG